MVIKFLKNKILILSIFLLTFNIVTDFKVKEVHANSLAGEMGGLLLEGSLAGVGSSVVAAAPYVAAFAVVCISLGIIYKNREEIQTAFINSYNYAKTQGKNLIDYFSTDSKGNVVVNSEGVNTIQGSVKSYLADSSISGSLGNFPIAGTKEAWKPAKTSINFSSTVSDTLILQVKALAEGSIITCNFFVNELSMDSNLGNLFSTKYYPNGAYIYFSYDASGWKYTNALSYDVLMNNIKNNIGIKTGDSICADFSLRFNASTDYQGSVSVDRLLGDSIGSFDNVNENVLPVNPSISLDRDLVIDIPDDLTWDKVIDKTYDETLPIESDIPGTGEGTGIWDWLKSLLNSILDAINSIAGTILAFFVIDWSLVSEHLVYDEIFKNKFKPFYDVTYLLKNINANPSTHSGKFYMVIPPEMGGDGQEHCVLDLTVANDFIVMGRSLLNASIWIGFLWYILKLFSPNLNIG